MGIQLHGINCDCGQMMTPQVGPNWTLVPAPGGDGVVFSCMSCKKILGVTILQPRG